MGEAGERRWELMASFGDEMAEEGFWLSFVVNQGSGLRGGSWRTFACSLSRCGSCKRRRIRKAKLWGWYMYNINGIRDQVRFRGAIVATVG